MDSMTRTGALAMLLMLVGCSTTEPRRYDTAELRAGDYRLLVDNQPSLRLLRIDDELFRFEADGMQLGFAGPVDDLTNYDPYRRFVPSGLYIPPVEPTFAWPTTAAFEPSDPNELRLRLHYDAAHEATLVARVGGDGRFALTFTPTLGVSDVAYLDLKGHASPDEGFYGLGEFSDQVEQRGQVRAMQIEVESTTEAGYNDGHAPVPFVVGTRGWGLFVESRYPGAFAVATEAADVITASFGLGTSANDGLAFHLFGAAHPLDVSRRYFDVTGTPGLPARWALGPWIWRDENVDQAEVERDLDAIRDRDLATTGVWVDRPYATGVNTFDFDAKRFPTPQAMLDKAHALGLRTALWHVPYLDEKDAATAALRAEAKSKGYYPKAHGLALNKWGTLLDLTNPDAVAWWQEHAQAYVDMGIEGFKLDYTEDVIIGPTANRVAWSFFDGSDERTQHSEFQLRYHRTYADLMPKGGGFLLTRAARWGDHVHGMVMWPGDLDASFAERGETVKDGDGTYLATGGLPASVVSGLSLSAAGFPFYGADTGGYRHSPPDNELFSRWFEQTALSTVMQVGTSTNDVPWEPTAQNGFDAALLDRYRAYARLHLRLFPYVWTHATRIAKDGRPIARALGLAYPELGAHPNDSYMLGDDLLVAPVLVRGQLAREVLFPPGRWVHWFTGETFDGDALRGKPTKVAAPIGRLPLFLRAGGLVPLLRPTIDALAPTTEPTRVDSYATDAGRLYVRAVSGTTGRFDLFDGGVLSHTTIGMTSTLAASPGAELSKGAIFELLGANAPLAVSSTLPLLERATLAELEQQGGYFYDASTRSLWVSVSASSTVEVTWT